MTGICPKAWVFHIYNPPKNLLKLTTNELPLEPVLLLLARLGEEEEEEVDMRVARSSYRACDSRGSWPKRPKAHGAAVEVGNREKEGVIGAMLEREEDIYDSSCCCTGRLGCLFPLASVCMDGWGCREKMRPWRGTPILVCLYLCLLTLKGRRRLMLRVLRTTTDWEGALFHIRNGPVR